MSFKTSATKIIDTLDSINKEKIDNCIFKLADRIVFAIRVPPVFPLSHLVILLALDLLCI